MKKRTSLITVLLMTLLLTLATSTGIFAAVTTDTVTPSATANYSLFYDSSSGKMYTDEYATNQYTGQSDKWSTSYDADSGSYILTLKGFSFTTSAENALVLPYNTKISLADGTTNTFTSTYTGTEVCSGIYAIENLNIYGKGNGLGKLTAQCTGSSSYYSDGIYCTKTLSMFSGRLFAYGGNDEESTGIDTYAFKMYSGEITAYGNGYSMYFFGDDARTVITYEYGAIFFAGMDENNYEQRNITNGSTDLGLFESYPFLQICYLLTDVTYNAWYHDCIYEMFDAGYIAGYQSSDYGPISMLCKIRPNNPITRAEFVTILARIFESETDLDQYAGEYAFTDVPDWASKYVGWATEYGYVNGIDGTHFGSGDNITREQMAAILYRVVNDMELTASSSNPAITFTDEGQIDDYALNAVRLMQQAGVINGYSNGDGSFRFQPKGQATRAEAFTMIYNFINAYNPE